MNPEYYCGDSLRHSKWINRVSMHFCRVAFFPLLPQMPGGFLLIFDLTAPSSRNPFIQEPVGPIPTEKWNSMLYEAKVAADWILRPNSNLRSSDERDFKVAAIKIQQEICVVFSGALSEIKQAILLYVALEEGSLSREEALKMAQESKNPYSYVFEPPSE